MYLNNACMIYNTMKLHGNVYPQDLTLHIYGTNGSAQLQVYDDWSNIYYHIHGEDLDVYTWQG